MMPPNSSRLCLLACKNFAADFSAAVAAEKLSDIDVLPFPVFCNLKASDRLWPEAFFEKLRQKYDFILVVGGLCLKSTCPAPYPPEISVICLEQCFYPIAPKPFIDHLLLQGSYLLNPTWLEKWRQHLSALGFDQATARSFFLESCEKLVFLDTKLQPSSALQLQLLSDFLDRPAETIPLGLDFIRLFILKIVAEARRNSLEKTHRQSIADFEKQIADYAMALDIITSCTNVSEENIVIENLLCLFHQIFAANEISFFAYTEDACIHHSLNSDHSIIFETVTPPDCPFEYELSPGEDSFSLRIAGNEETYGLLKIGKFEMPQYLNHYFTLALSLAKVCALVIEIARANKNIRLLNSNLQQQLITIENQTLDLQTANQQLQMLNSDLEAFSYSVSHDLCAPLRNIEAYLNILKEHHSSQLSEKASYILVRLEACTQKMNLLIKDMLNLSRVNRTPMNQSRINLSLAVEKILDDLREAEPTRCVNTIVQEDIFTFADPSLLNIMLSNLLGNAWKFTAKKTPARIEFGITLLEGVSVFFIRDNGAGFDMALAGKLFAPFQRLHSAEEYPGTGIGLATVLRVIRRHGGKISVDAALEKGATFYFTLSP